MKNEPRVGQLVYLNSGSPALTILAIHTHDRVTVCWITPEGEPYSSTYHRQCLTELEVPAPKETSDDNPSA